MMDNTPESHVDYVKSQLSSMSFVFIFVFSTMGVVLLGATVIGLSNLGFKWEFIWMPICGLVGAWLGGGALLGLMFPKLLLYMKFDSRGITYRGYLFEKSVRWEEVIKINWEPAPGDFDYDYLVVHLADSKGRKELRRFPTLGYSGAELVQIVKAKRRKFAPKK